jgi:hypothetical protein
MLVVIFNTTFTRWVGTEGNMLKQRRERESGRERERDRKP